MRALIWTVSAVTLLSACSPSATAPSAPAPAKPPAPSRAPARAPAEDKAADWASNWTGGDEEEAARAPEDGGSSRIRVAPLELTVSGARGKGTPLAEMPIPASYRWVPAGVPKGSPYNVAQLYARFAESIRSGAPMHPSFDDAVTRHRMLDAIVAASTTGQKQVLV